MSSGARMHAAADLRAAPEQVDHAESIAGVSSSWFGREEGELGTHTFVTFGRRNASLRQPQYPTFVTASPRAFDWYPFHLIPTYRSASSGVAPAAGLLAACACRALRVAASWRERSTCRRCARDGQRT